MVYVVIANKFNWPGISGVSIIIRIKFDCYCVTITTIYDKFDKIGLIFGY